MSIERNFDVSFTAAMALREKQIQQNYRPIIAVHKWFARRPGTLFRALALAEFSDKPIQKAFFEAHDFAGKRIADPFMGGGTPLIEANRLGCDVLGFDINPMAAWIVREEIEHLDLAAYRRAAGRLVEALQEELDGLYRTDCPLYGDKNVPVKYFIWVKEVACEACGKDVSLFPGYLLSQDARHPFNVVVCASCGGLNEVEHTRDPGRCTSCRGALVMEGPAGRGSCACPHCKHVNAYPRPRDGPPRHRLFAIEYYNPRRKAGHKGRFFKKPDAKDLGRYGQAELRWAELSPDFVPEQEILPGDETDRLHRWGYRRYRELFNPRQLLGLELSARLIAKVRDQRVRHALATNLSDLLRYQNMLCRYDSMALKSLDIFSVHGFPVGLIHCESNILGIVNGNDVNVGSGGWTNIVDKYAKAKSYCDQPFEVRRVGRAKVRVPIAGEWIGERLNGARPRVVEIRCASSTSLELPDGSLDAVFTDPPYFGNVQYGELMDFCYVWLRRLVGDEAEGFRRASTRDPGELTGNATQGRDIGHFANGLSSVYRKMARALRPGAPLVFTYHHNKAEAYHAVGIAILDARLVCSASIPCPAEMGGSIHIHGTASSIIDTVFVCRSDSGARQSLFRTPADLVRLVCADLDQLRAAGVRPSAGDIRCITLGHVTREAVWALRRNWNEGRPIKEKLALLADRFSAINLEALVAQVQAASPADAPKAQKAFSFLQ
jgi:adenine-specific DNA methylase